MPWHSPPEVAPISTAPAVSDIDKSTAALVLEKREPVVMKYSSKSGKKGGKKSAEDDNEKNLVCNCYTACTICVYVQSRTLDSMQCSSVVGYTSRGIG